MSKTTWQIDPTHSAVEFSVKHLMFTTVRGRFKDLKGTVELDEQNPGNSRVEVEIFTSSIDTGVADRDAHLRSADFFDVENFPAITFRSKQIEGASKNAGESFKVTGELTIRGESREITLDTVYLGAATDPWGNFKAGFEASAKVDRREFGLTWNQALEAGGILVGNDIKIELQIQAAKVEAAA